MHVQYILHSHSILHVRKHTGMVRLSVNGECDMKQAQPSEEACSKYWQVTLATNTGSATSGKKEI